MKQIPLVEPGLLNQSIRAVGTPLFILLGVGEMAVSSIANILSVILDNMPFRLLSEILL